MTFFKKTIWIILSFFLFNSPELSLAKQDTPANSLQPRLVISEQSHDLGVIAKGTEFGWAFLFENKGTGDLNLLKAYSSIPGQIKVSMPPVIGPGERGQVYIGQDSNQIQGRNTLEVTIQTNDPQNPQAVLSVSGYVKWPVEILPVPVVLMKVPQGESSEKRFTLENNTATEMKVDNIEFDKALFNVALNELEKGKKIGVTISSNPDASSGEYRGKIIFHTNVEQSPQVSMGTWLTILGRIYTSLQALDFGSLSLTDLQEPRVVDWTSELVLVNGMSTPGFKVLKADCDVDFLKVEIDSNAKNNIYRVDVFFDSPKVKKGEFKGSLKILTNDEEFKEITLPVYGIIR